MSISRSEESARDVNADSPPPIEDVEDVKARLESLNTQVTTFIKDHAGACMVGALALGYILARIARGRS